MSDTRVTLTYTQPEARRVASAIRYFVSNVDALPEDADRLNLIATAIEAQAQPPSVYEHLVLQQRGKTVESVCGKAWIPTDAVTVVGKCPECRAGANRWQA